MSAKLPGLDVIREAILNAPDLPDYFPFPALQSADTLDKIRNSPTLHTFLDEIRSEANRASTNPRTPLTFSIFRLFETTGDRSVYQEAYFDRNRRLAGLTLATIVDETDAYLPALSDLIWEICNEYTWALPAHIPAGIEHIKANPLPPAQIVDLFSAETAHTLAEVSHILGDKLDDWLHYRIRTEIEKRVFHPIFTVGHQFRWETARMNWASVCGGSVGMTALLLENDPERLITIIDRMVRTMECFLTGFGADGGCPEGIGYWVYGFSFYSYFADMLHAYTDGALDLFDNETVKQIVTFPGKVNLGGRNFINYSDVSANVIIPPGIASYLSKRFQHSIPGLQSPGFHSDHVYRWTHIARDLLWTDEKHLHQSPVEGTFYLNDIQWLIDKQRINGTLFTFSAKGGHNDEPHNHNDLGHFILNIGGESILADLGSGEYTKQYFGNKRYDSLHTGSQGHSVPIINGKTQRAGSDYIADVTGFDKRETGLTFSLDLTRAYDVGSLHSFVRSFEWQFDSANHRASLILSDTFAFDKASEKVEEYFISLINPTIKGNTVSWVGQTATVHMTFDPQEIEPTVETLQTHGHNLKPFTVYRLQLQLQKKAHITATFKFMITLNR